MNILFDFVTLSRRTGAGEYVRCVFLHLLESVSRQQPTDVHLHVVWDSARGCAYDDMASIVADPALAIKRHDIHSKAITAIVDEHHIDTFFIGCAQYLGIYNDVSRLHCRVICVIHDLCYEEMQRENLDLYYKSLTKSTASFVNWLLFHRNKWLRKNNFMPPVVEMLHQNGNATVIAVSEYTKHSIMYSYDIPENRIKVLYSPERVYQTAKGDVGESLRNIFSSNSKVFLLLGAQYDLKNSRKAINAFAHYSRQHPDAALLTVGYRGAPRFAAHHVLPFLSDSELQYAYKSCHALIYPSYFEGFGYPPIEAMHFGKPVIATNIGAVREILEIAPPIFFCPFFETDIYQALCRFDAMDYAALCRQSREAYTRIAARQAKDLDTITELIMSKTE